MESYNEERRNRRSGESMCTCHLRDAATNRVVINDTRGTADSSIRYQRTTTQQGNLFRNVEKEELEDALKMALEGISPGQTIEEVEELLEIQFCREIERSVGRFIREKKVRLRERNARRDSELYSRKVALHKALIDRISEDQKEQNQTRTDLMRVLEESSNSSSGQRSRFRESISMSANRRQPQGTQNLHEIEVTLSGSRIPPQTTHWNNSTRMPTGNDFSQAPRASSTTRINIDS